MQSVTERVKAALDRIRPSIQEDGGDLRLVDVDEREGLVRVALTGACEGCAAASLTLQYGIERNLRLLVPEVRQVEAVETL